MARRDSDYRTRRIADRGNEEDGPDSRARGDRFYHNRRSADRGNEMVDRNPRDIFEIKRLRRRVQDLEIQHEIKQIRKRIRELEFQIEMHKTETESSTLVGDEGGNGEQQSFNGHPSQFYEPIYQECFLEEKPRFDEDMSKIDDEECLWVQKALSRFSNRDNKKNVDRLSLVDQNTTSMNLDEDGSIKNNEFDLLDSKKNLVSMETGSIIKETQCANLGNSIDSSDLHRDEINAIKAAEIFGHLNDHALKRDRINFGNELNISLPVSNEINGLGKNLQMKDNILYGNKKIVGDKDGYMHHMHKEITCVLSIAMSHNMKENSNEVYAGFISRPGHVGQSELKNKGQWRHIKLDGQIRGFSYVFDPGGRFLRLSKLEDEFFLRGRV